MVNINIRRGKLIEPYIQSYISQKYPNFVFPTEEEVLDKIKLFKDVYEKKGKKMLIKTMKILDMKFKRNFIDVFIVASIDRDQSAPFIIRSRYNEEEFLEALIHELIHVLCVDNHGHPLLNKINEIYSKENKSVRNHILVYYVFRELNYPIKSFPSSSINDDYLRAIKLSKEFKK